MNIQEGPAFGALIIGAGVGYLLYTQTQNMALAIVAGLGIGLADYALLVWIGRFKKK